MALDIRNLTPGFGAELHVGDVSRLDETEIGAVRNLWIEHGILLFRGQELNEQSQVAFSRHFGALEIHVRSEYLSPEFPEVLLVSNLQKPDGAPLGILADRDVGWHYDQIYLAKPALGSMLHAVTVPPEGGRTYFADMAAVYAALPDDLKRRIEGRRAVQSYEHFNRAFSVPTSKTQKARTQDVAHPVVRTHPYSKRKSLYICPGMTTEILGLKEAESREILDRLFEFSVRPEFVYGHDWQPGDSILWDNARSMHRRDPFDARHQRLMKRTTILMSDALAAPF